MYWQNYIKLSYHSIYKLPEVTLGLVLWHSNIRFYRKHCQ